MTLEERPLRHGETGSEGPGVSLKRALLTMTEALQSLLLYSDKPWLHEEVSSELEDMLNDLYTGHLEPYDYYGDTDVVE